MAKEHEDADCVCHTCQRWFHHGGIARHRAAHRDRREACEITYSTGRRITHAFDFGRPAQNAA